MNMNLYTVCFIYFFIGLTLTDSTRSRFRDFLYQTTTKQKIVTSKLENNPIAVQLQLQHIQIILCKLFLEKIYYFGSLKFYSSQKKEA